MPGGGRLTIRTANHRVEPDSGLAGEGLPAGDYVMLSVADTGAGMSREVAERAFEPFFTTKGVGRGTGLGLSTVYGFAKQSGGHATIESVPDKGTTVSILLPRSADDIRDPASPAAPSKSDAEQVAPADSRSSRDGSPAEAPAA
jgi:signal transduction histidine kinase